MTKEEAIRLLDPKTTGGAISEIEYYAGFSGKKAAIHAIDDALEIAVELLKADVDGRCVVLPCKVGDPAWAITNYYGKKKPKEGTISEIYFSKDMRIVVALKGIARGEIGKTIFLTKEEVLAELHKQCAMVLKGGAENA